MATSGFLFLEHLLDEYAPKQGIYVLVELMSCNGA